MPKKTTHQEAFTKYLNEIHAKAKTEYNLIKGKTKKTYMDVLKEVQKRNPFKSK